MIITSSKLISGKRNNSPLNEWAVVINEGIIRAIGPIHRILQQFSHQRVYMLKNAVLMPGLVNVHSHLELPELLNTVQSKAFPDWILNLITAKKCLSLNNYISATKKNIHTIIQSGTTTIGEICTHGVSPDLLRKSGLRAVVFRELIRMGPERSKSKVHSSKIPLSGLINVGISPHSPYTVSESVLLQIRDTARQRNLRLAMHIAESKDELKLLQRRKSGLEKLYQYANWDYAWAPKGRSSFEYLSRIGFLSPRLLAVHAIQVSDKDIDLIKKTKVSIAHCPRSNKETGVGKMPLKKFLDAGITVGLGTDSLASSPSLNMWDEMRYAHQIHRRSGISAKDIFGLATINGAKVLGLDKKIGTIEPGKKADIIAVPLPAKNTGNLYSDLLRETKSCIITMVNGTILHKVG
jgi:cytosine/adenosine deaminase-related metal-dependent hydrolase